VRNLELAHEGDDAVPFLTARSLRFRRGEWTFVKGISGSGKTSLIKALNGLWPYGRGTISFPEGVKSFYAAQDVKLPRISLKELVCLPDRPEDHTDVSVAAALHRSAGNLAAAPERNQHGRMHRWRVVLLGGALVTVSVAAVLPGSHATWLDSSMLLLAATATSVTVVARFYGVVKKREAAEERLAHQAHHDHLTGLANRALLLGRLGDALERRAGGDLVLAYLDLDGFKNINDVHGHGGGDAVLFEVGERLRRLVRSGDTVSRLGGDEFVLLCHGVGEDAIEPLGDKLRSVVSAPIVLPSGEVVSVGLSVGIAPVRVPQSPAGLDGVLAEQLLRGADDAMYVAKHRGGGVCIADPIA